MLEDAIQQYGDRPALAYKPKGDTYQDISYATLGESVAAFRSGLIAHGIQKGDRVAILSENRPEWAIADFGILSAGAINRTPIFNTDSSTSWLYFEAFRRENYLCVNRKAVGKGNRYPLGGT